MPLARRLLVPGLVLAYAFVVLGTLSLLPLWLDEIHQLLGTRDATMVRTLQWSRTGPGGAPLSYLIQNWTLQIAGFSRFTARLPAALSGISAGLALLWTAARIGLPARPLLFVFYATLPMLFRYAQEARPYSQAVCLSVVSLALFLTWLEQPKLRWLVLYGCSVAAGLYTQPFTLFPVIATLLWCVLERPARWPVAWLAGGSAMLLFVPWLLSARHAAAQAHTMERFFFNWQQVSPLLVLHELSGGGYVSTIALLLLAAAGTVSRLLQPDLKRLLMSIVLLSLLGPIVADALAGYFFASRQLMFALPALLLLAVAGACQLWTRSRLLAVALAVVLVVSSIVKDYRYAHTVKEDWQLAASRLAELSEHACIVTVPASDLDYFAFFQPGLALQTCGQGRGLQRAIVVQTPYTSREDLALGLSRVPAMRASGPPVEVGGTKFYPFQER